MLKYIKGILFVLGVALIIPLNAQEIPENKNNPRLVVDQANVFTEHERAILEQELKSFSDTTSNQIVVVTMNDLQGFEPYEVATKIGHEWGVGQSGFDNGIVILIKPKNSKSKGRIHIATGYGLEGIIPDATGKLIVEHEIIPYFKQNLMFQGVESGLRTIKSLSVGEYNSKDYSSRSEGGSWFPIVFILIVIIFSFLGKARSARSYSVGRGVPFWTAMMLMNQSSVHGGHYNNFTSGGGGFGGFGGGGFGGGGAGGSW